MADHTVDDHFTGKPVEVRKIYDKLVSLCRRFGEVVEDPKKTSIHLNRHSAFTGVEVRREYLLVNIKSEQAIKSPRVPKSERLSAKRFHQKVKMSSVKDVDAELKGWLKAAYGLSG